MAADFAAGEHTAALWHQVKPIVSEIEQLPFLDQLAAGTLDTRIFTHYLLQDGLYLNGYSRAMALLAGRTRNRAESRFWASSAATVITEEEHMQQALLADPQLASVRDDILGGRDEPVASPTTLGYVSYLLAGAATQSYDIGVARVLPCFWVYAHIGAVLAELAGDLAESHPYKAWIDTYDSADFDTATRQAVAILENLLTQATPAEHDQMSTAFTQSCAYELHFWASAHAEQNWDAAQFARFAGP